jgi:hypothetical protein
MQAQGSNLNHRECRSCRVAFKFKTFEGQKKIEGQKKVEGQAFEGQLGMQAGEGQTRRTWADGCGEGRPSNQGISKISCSP